MEPLVLVPGVQGRWEYMRRTVDALSVHFRVVTFSLRGNSIDEYADQVARALDERKIDRAIVCGVSFGGRVALRFAATASARTSALVLVSTPGPAWHLRPRHVTYTRWPRVFGPLFLAEAPWRLRAELLSALIGSISLLPFVLSSGTGAEIEKPLAIVVVGGLVMSPIKIVMLPMVYEWVESVAARRAARRVDAAAA